MHSESYFEVIDSARLVISVFLFPPTFRKNNLESIYLDFLNNFLYITWLRYTFLVVFEVMFPVLSYVGLQSDTNHNQKTVGFRDVVKTIAS